MLLLNQPYSVYSRTLDHDLRRLAARRALLCVLYCLCCLLVGLTLGIIISN